MNLVNLSACSNAMQAAPTPMHHTSIPAKAARPNNTIYFAAKSPRPYIDLKPLFLELKQPIIQGQNTSWIDLLEAIDKASKKHITARRMFYGSVMPVVVPLLTIFTGMMAPVDFAARAASRKWRESPNKPQYKNLYHAVAHDFMGHLTYRDLRSVIGKTMNINLDETIEIINKLEEFDLLESSPISLSYLQLTHLGHKMLKINQRFIQLNSKNK